VFAVSGKDATAMAPSSAISHDLEAEFTGSTIGRDPPDFDYSYIHSPFISQANKRRIKRVFGLPFAEADRQSPKNQPMAPRGEILWNST
jgi:hypothetical protein